MPKQPSTSNATPTGDGMAPPGWRVLVPRAGQGGERVAAALRREGAAVMIAPLIEIVPVADSTPLIEAFGQLLSGTVNWLVVTSVATVEVMVAFSARLGEGTRVAAVGEVTARALRAAGYRCDFVPTSEQSARGLLRELPLPGRQRLLLPQSEIAEPLLVEGWRHRGHEVQQVAAYRTLPVPAADEMLAAVAAGEFQAIVVTSGSIARELRRQFAVIPERTLIACIGPRTADVARELGISVAVTATEPNADSLAVAIRDAVQRF